MISSDVKPGDIIIDRYDGELVCLVISVLRINGRHGTLKSMIKLNFLSRNPDSKNPEVQFISMEAHASIKDYGFKCLNVVST